MNPVETFYDAATGQTVIRELTAEEIAALPQSEDNPADPE